MPFYFFEQYGKEGEFGHFIKTCLRIELKTLVLAPLQVDLQEHKPKRSCELLQLVKNAHFNHCTMALTTDLFSFFSLKNQGRNEFLIDINFCILRVYYNNDNLF